MHGVAHGVAKLIGGILRTHGEVGFGRDGRGARRLNLRLRLGRNGLCGLRLGLDGSWNLLLLRGRWRRLLQLAVQLIQRLPVDRGFGGTFGLLEHGVGRQIQEGQILLLPERNHLRHLEDVGRNPGNNGDQDEMDQDGARMPRAAATSAARLRARRSFPGARKCCSRSSANCDGGESRLAGLRVLQHASVRALYCRRRGGQLLPRGCLSAGSSRLVPWARSLRLALRWWAFDPEEPLKAHISLAGSVFESFLSILSSLATASAQVPRPVQWFPALLN